MIMIMSLITMIMIMIREFCDDDDINNINDNDQGVP